MNWAVFTVVIIIGVPAYMLTNLVWESNDGKITKEMRIGAAILIVLIALLFGHITKRPQ